MEKIETPIRPKDIIDNLENIIPNVIIVAVNNLLKAKFRGDSVTIKQKDIMSEINRLDETMTSKKVYDNKWMDFESIYRKSGWSVSYDKPAYDENYDATFEFRPKK